MLVKLEIFSLKAGINRRICSRIQGRMNFLVKVNPILVKEIAFCGNLYDKKENELGLNFLTNELI